MGPAIVLLGDRAAALSTASSSREQPSVPAGVAVCGAAVCAALQHVRTSEMQPLNAHASQQVASLLGRECVAAPLPTLRRPLHHVLQSSSQEPETSHMHSAYPRPQRTQDPARGWNAPLL